MNGKRKDQIATTMAKIVIMRFLVNMTKATICPEFADTLFLLAKIHP